MAKLLFRYFLMLILALQFLPFKEISQNIDFLNSSEEIEDFSTGNKETDKGEDEFEPKNLACLALLYVENPLIYQFKKRVHFTKKSSFPSRIFDDILTPPPLFRF